MENIVFCGNENDFCHSETSPAQVQEYAFDHDKQILTGKIFFNERAQGHGGFCHGGATCAIMDDLIGWYGFCTGNSEKKCVPWSAYTIQVNVSLRKPIPVNRSYRCKATLIEQARSKSGKLKIHAKATIVSEDGNTTYATATGWSIKTCENNCE